MKIVIIDSDAKYFGAPLQERALVPAANARLGHTRFADWLSSSATRK